MYYYISNILTSILFLSELSAAPKTSNRWVALMPEDLQNLIMKTNPGRRVRFTMSQRMAPELVVEDYVMKRKQGPFRNRLLGVRSVTWKCTETGCPYTCRTLEGSITGEIHRHNHPPDKDALVRKEARALMKLAMTSDRDQDQLVRDLLGRETGLQEDVTNDGTPDGTVTYGGNHDTKPKEEGENIVNIREDIMVDKDLNIVMEIKKEIVCLEELSTTESYSTSDNPKILVNQQGNDTFKIIEVDTLLNSQITSHQNKSTVDVKGIEIFDCNKCPVSFQYIEKLTSHKIHFHIDTDSFYCKECGINFYTLDLMTRHQIMHTEEQASKQSCNECDLTFSSPEDTRKHIVSHKNKTTFPCSECSFVSSVESSLKSHMDFHRIEQKNNNPSSEHESEKSSKKQLDKNTKVLDKSSANRKVTEPPNAFIVFCRQERSKLISAGLHSSKIDIELASRWTDLKQHEKLPFFQETERLKNAHLTGSP